MEVHEQLHSVQFLMCILAHHSEKPNPSPLAWFWVLMRFLKLFEEEHFKAKVKVIIICCSKSVLQ